MELRYNTPVGERELVELLKAQNMESDVKYKIDLAQIALDEKKLAGEHKLKGEAAQIITLRRTAALEDRGLRSQGIMQLQEEYLLKSQLDQLDKQSKTRVFAIDMSSQALEANKASYAISQEEAALEDLRINKARADESARLTFEKEQASLRQAAAVEGLVSF